MPSCRIRRPFSPCNQPHRLHWLNASTNTQKERTTNVAAAMRLSARLARAYHLVEATRIIQDALAQRTGFQQSAADSKRAPSLRLIDPGAEIISSRTRHERVERRPPGD